jgi:Dolichyl-phosphate-mannose-protein mannosyltransferase
VSLAVAISAWAAVAIVFAVALAFGFRALELLGFPHEDAFESGLLAAGISFPLIGFVVFGLSIPGWLRPETAWGLIVVLAIAASRGWFGLREWAGSALKKICSRFSDGSFVSRATLALLVLTISLEVLLSMAPLTGSDAMHYHFTAPLLEMGNPLRPIFWLTHSFLIEQAHLLISLGVALGSDRISLGLITLGGILTAAVLFVIARQLMSFDWALLAVLAFLNSPMVFWQITTSGSPDIWMGFYTGLVIIAASRGVRTSSLKFLLLAAFYAGAAAGVKYTGWIVPFALSVYILVASRSCTQMVSCGLVSLATGALTQVRNFVWTGDPFFPFLMPWLKPTSVDSFALHGLVMDTRSSGYSLHVLHLLTFPFSMTLDGNKYGLGQYFGPLVLAFAPLLLFARWKSHTAKLAGIFWALMLLLNALSTQMGRFLLPVYILALVLVFSGIAEIFERGWRIAAYGSAATLVLFLTFAGLSDLIYARDFLPVVFGHESKEAFLQRMAPEYRFTSFVNAELGQRTQNGNGNAMVFQRHLYYLRIPYVYGDPTASWAVDPAKCSDPGGLLRVLRELNVRWVVKESDYPAALADSFSRLEAEKKLIPIASADLETLTGNSRIYRVRQTVRVTILQLMH